MDTFHPKEPVSLTTLDDARLKLEAGDVESARSLASSVLQTANDQGDLALQAAALMALAQYDRVLGRFQRAIEAAHQAVQRFQLDGDIAGEASALSLLAHASSILGRDAEAVEAALLGVRLGELLPPGLLQVNLHNYLGVSYLWSKSYAMAELSLRESERLALLYSADHNVLLPRTNLVWLEVMRLSNARYFASAMPSTANLRDRLTLCAPLLEDGPPLPMLPGVRAVLQRFARSSMALCLAWEGDLAGAQQQWMNAQDRHQPAKYAQVANVISHWVSAEIHWGRLELQQAEDEAGILIELAGAAEFEQMAHVGHLLKIQIFKAQGKLAGALEEEIRHRQRELRVRGEILDRRHAVVQTHLDMRSSERHLKVLAQHSQELERLSFEDALTGIANRRRFDMQLAWALGAGAEHPLCVALIDVNDFKSVNDTYSHAAGDDVLKSIASAIRVAVRANDLTARLGGDEFVILFPHTPLEVADAICERIRDHVAALRWRHWSDALQVRVSIGTALAEPDDTGDTLLQRSDLQMFKVKTQTGAPSLAARSAPH